MNAPRQDIAPQDIEQWRRQRRVALRAQRRSVPAAQRRAWNDAIADRLAACFATLQIRIAGFYWPFDGEFDARRTMCIMEKCGVTVALPVVAQRHAPMEFRRWWPAAPMTRGVLGLPVPAGTERVVPEALLIPLLGFDVQGYRLGYGGGYFDRTLAALTPQPLKIGVGFEIASLETIHPQWHDVPMDFIVSESAARWVSREGVQRIESPALAAELAQAVLERRRTCAQDPRHEAAQYASPSCYAHEFDLYGKHD